MARAGLTHAPDHVERIHGPPRPLMSTVGRCKGQKLKPPSTVSRTVARRRLTPLPFSKVRGGTHSNARRI